VPRSAAHRVQHYASDSEKRLPQGGSATSTEPATIVRYPYARQGQYQGRGTIKDIQAHLRHAQPNVTAEVYMQAIPESVRSAVESLDLLLAAGHPDFEQN
jgi:hypothetical protein